MKFLVFLFLATSVSASFTDDVYQILSKEDADKNIISSPLSLEIVMAMLYMGSNGNTAKELQAALKLPGEKKDVAKKYKDFFSNLHGREKVAILELANRIYVNDQWSLVPEFNKIVADSFKAEAVPINVRNPKSAAATINSWVSGHTRNKITEIVTYRDITPDLVMVLINAIYFKGDWQYKFNKANTKKNIFRTSSNQELQVDMMSMDNIYIKANKFADLDAKVIELPYRNSSLSMQIFLPNRIDGLSKLESQIGGFDRALRQQNVDIVKIPKFKIEFEKKLVNVLKKLRIQSVFGNDADLSGMVLGPTKVSKVLQKAYLEVNEEGAEAAAVTAGMMVTLSKCVGCSISTFIADHPFAFLIRDGKTIYFQGHFVKP
ncbi:serine protease inhibitor 42Dd-like [Drosophila bipectinata]|uniref:serine protease inhibitor 42Dd-like n=1 Tax=Drosophila bipectinata TaxID=42026 RepID=UPI001C89750C|nr:serine protease inhibitor 42Dd-like [Drosophila bipectinata]